MTRADVTFRRATQADAERFFGGTPKMSFKGFVAELEGEIIGIGGYYWQGQVPIAFTEMREPLRRFKKARAKACRLLTGFFDELRLTVYALPCPTEPTAPYLLAKLGFKPSGFFGPMGETLVREPSWRC